MKSFDMGRNRADRTRAYSRRKLSPMVEVMERRQMLDAATGYLAGTVSFDATGSGQFGSTNTVLPGATIDLYVAGTSKIVATTTSDASGNYLFTGLAAGNYTLLETPPAADSAVNAQAISQIDPAQKTSANTINVTVVPTQEYLKYSGVAIKNQVNATVSVEGTTQQNSLASLKAAVGSTSGASNLSSSFLTNCLDDLTMISLNGGESWPVDLQPITSLSANGTSTVSAATAGRIAYLYNHYGNSSLTNIQQAGLQLALWELEYDGNPTPDFTAGAFHVLGPITPTDQATLNQAVSQATAYYNESLGHDETALLLNASAAATPGSTDYQSMIVSQTFNFLNAAKPKTPTTPTTPTTPPSSGNGGGSGDPASLSGFVYCDANNDGVFESTEMPLSGVVVSLTGTTTGGLAVTETVLTDASGAYHFLNLLAGTYTITETQPTGYNEGIDTQGTPGNGVVAQDVFRSISLAAGVYGQNNNFGETMIPVTVTGVTLYGVHENPTSVTATFSGPVKPEQATDPANYTLIYLGKDNVYGTADDQYVAIKSVTYDAATNQMTIAPATHLNIHYHYILSVNLPGDSCAPAVQSNQIFGRAQVPVFDNHQVNRPAPKMLAWEIARDHQVVARTKATLARRGLIR